MMERIVSLNQSGDASVPLLTRSHQKRGQKACYCYSIRRPKGKGAFLVLLWNFLIFSYRYAALGSIVNIIVGARGSLAPWMTSLLYVVLETSLPKFLYPVAGWLADAKFGRYKVMRVSIWIMWIGSVVLSVAQILEFALDHDHTNDDTFLPVYIIVYILNAIGIAGYHANVIPFGIDQMEDGSSDNYSAFIHWYYWTRNFSLGLMLQTFFAAWKCPSHGEADTKNQLYVLIAEVAFLSLALCTDFLFSHVLIKEPKTQNPLKMVVKVSSFILENKSPVGHRSALTFNSWQAAIPTRSSFAKKSYGGPFESEAVEDVKVFWYILVFLFSTGSFYLVENAVSLPTTMDAAYIVSHPFPPPPPHTHTHTHTHTHRVTLPMIYLLVIPV